MGLEGGMDVVRMRLGVLHEILRASMPKIAGTSHREWSSICVYKADIRGAQVFV